VGKYTRKFNELSSTDRPLVGGKCASLGEMVQAGLPVPDGFAVTVDAYEDYRDASDLRQQLLRIVLGADAQNNASLQQAHDEAVELIPAANCRPPSSRDPGNVPALAADRSGVAASPDRIRRGTPGDGRRRRRRQLRRQQETYLCRGEDDVIANPCWASLYTPQAIAYRSGMSAAEASDASKISVAVQLMAHADVAGVTFTVSPRTGDRSVIAINASWGLGQAVVSGEVTPDEYWLNKIGPTLTSTRIASKAHEYVPAPGGVGVELRM
jgi:pyruvate,water dikinase